MACTVAVEESISEHYNSQIRALMEKDPERYIELLQVSLAFHFTITFIDSPLSLLIMCNMLSVTKHKNKSKLQWNFFIYINCNVFYSERL